MPGLNNVSCGDGYTDAATVSDVWNSKGGWFSVSTQSVYVQLQYGDLGSSYWVTEQLLGAGAFASVDDTCVGVRFRNATAGQTASVTAYLAQGNEPPLSIIAAGNVTVTGSPGTLLKTSYLVSGTSYTTGSATNQIRATLVGGGGGGANGGGAGQAGSGGGAGCTYYIGQVTVSPSTAYAYAIGAAGAQGNPPTNGGDTTLTIGVTTYTATGGAGGANGAGYTLGGAGGLAIGTPLAVAGEQGGASVTFNAGAYMIGGKGGSTAYGGGGPGAMGTTPQSPGAATGKGAGGGGGTSTNAGTAGRPGLIIIEEFS